MVCSASKGLLNMRAVRDTATKYKQYSTKQPGISDRIFLLRFQRSNKVFSSN